LTPIREEEVIPISKPLIGAEEQAAVQRVLASGVLAQGPRVAEFERAFADFVGAKHAVATSNGTTALHAALLAHGIGPADEVITTPFTFIASVNSILYTGARPVFVDIDDRFNIDPRMLEAAITARTRAIMPVHLYGQPADMDAIMAIARDHNLAVVEDACQAHGAEFGERKVGTFGTGCFSFYATKNMTTGEGGMLTTDDADIAQRARRVINHGMRVRYYHEELGYNYRMTDLAAAIGVEQLKKLPAFNARRAEHADFYNQLLADVPGLVTPTIGPARTHVFHQYTLRVTPAFGHSRDAVAEMLGEQGIATGVYYPVPVHRQAALQGLGIAADRLPVAERFAEQALSLPVHPGITDRDRAFIVEALVGLSVTHAQA
jgi:dTDP-4-amino-4,6-dideoxygalactose transaminase